MSNGFCRVCDRLIAPGEQTRLCRFSTTVMVREGVKSNPRKAHPSERTSPDGSLWGCRLTHTVCADFLGSWTPEEFTTWLTQRGEAEYGQHHKPDIPLTTARKPRKNGVAS